MQSDPSHKIKRAKFSKSNRFFCTTVVRTKVSHQKTFTAVLLLCTEDDNSSYRNVCKMSVVSFALAVKFIIRQFREFDTMIIKIIALQEFLTKNFLVCTAQ